MFIGLRCSLALLCFAWVCIGDFKLSQLNCLSNSVGRASCLESVRRGLESHLSAAFSLATHTIQIKWRVATLYIALTKNVTSQKKYIYNGNNKSNIRKHVQ